MCNRGVGNGVGGAEIMVVVGKGWKLGKGNPAKLPLTCRAEGCSRLDSGFSLHPWNMGLFPAMCTQKKKKKRNVKDFGDSGLIYLFIAFLAGVKFNVWKVFM